MFRVAIAAVYYAKQEFKEEKRSMLLAVRYFAFRVSCVVVVGTICNGCLEATNNATCTEAVHDIANLKMRSRSFFRNETNRVMQ